MGSNPITHVEGTGVSVMEFRFFYVILNREEAGSRRVQREAGEAQGERPFCFLLNYEVINYDKTGIHGCSSKQAF